MKYLIFTILLGCSISSKSQKISIADSLLTDLVSKKGIVGITAGYSINGETKWENSAGYSCLDVKKPFSDSTLTRIASIAKPMTAVAIMQLVEQGLITLDASIYPYLPEFPSQDKAEITIRQLLSHTSGISQYNSEKEIENTINYPTLADAIKVFDKRPLLFSPGSKYFYTTYGYVLLGRIIETVSGLTYENYMQKNIWDKAEMSNTAIEKIDKTYEGKSCLYHKNARKAKSAKQNDLSNRVPGGGIYSTLNDMIKFGNALLNEKLITARFLDSMMVTQFEQKEGNPYGLGWFFYAPKPFENGVIGHSGEQTGCASQLMIIPKSKTVVVVLANTSGTWKDVVTFSSQLIGISEERNS